MMSGAGDGGMGKEQGYIPDRVKKAEKRIEVNPFDVDAWSVLIREAQNQNIDKARNTYERLVGQFQTAGRYWKIYIEAEMKARNYERVEKLFQRCLMKVLNIDLWKCYLNYVRETKGSLPSYREKMAQAYDFALDKMGMDIMSYQIWSDYISFLKGVEAVGSYAENQRITAVRRVYQRGCVNPMVNIEQLWREYNQYETGINPIIAKKMIEDRSRDYMNARRVAKEYEAVTRGLNRNMPSIPPTGTPDEVKQVDLWKKYISWEKGNPLRTEDHAVIAKRVIFAYEQCMLCLGHRPDIWYEAAKYLEESSKLLSEKGDLNAGKMFSDEAAAMYERAISTLLKKNMMLYFSYADFEENRMKHQKVHSIYNKLLGMDDIDPTLGYIQYMKFARRAEGIKSARSIFKRAREDDRSKYHVYVSAALMEYFCSKDKNIACKIFELGLKKYSDSADYILQYLDFLSHLNEDNNTRVLFERVLTSGALPVDKQGEIFAKFLEFECSIGDLSSVLKVEKRRRDIFKEEFEDRETCLLVDRYKYLDLFPLSTSELKAVGFKLRPTAGDMVSGSEMPAAVLPENDEFKKPEYPKPATDQMLPFKPRALAPPGMHPVPGGVFPMPLPAASLLNLMPPPTCFHGPFVNIDDLVKTFETCALPEDSSQLVDKMCNGEETSNPKLFPIPLNNSDSGKKGQKRPAENEIKEESDDEDNVAPPAHDIYRSRQQKRVR